MMGNNTAATAEGMDAFFTRASANAGILLPLYRPDGTKSEHWLRILGVDSDAFRVADSTHRRDALRIVQIQDKVERAQAIEDSKRRLIASLVVDWSFEAPCTADEVEKFLREAPQIMDAIDTAAGRRALFLGAGSSSSQPSQSTSSDST